jgi:hypothetical protein
MLELRRRLADLAAELRAVLAAMAERTFRAAQSAAGRISEFE